jgi:hypothetical protein
LAGGEERKGQFVLVYDYEEQHHDVQVDALRFGVAGEPLLGFY